MADDLKLINLVEKVPSLYNGSKSLDAEKCWQGISRKLNIPIENCKCRWKNLRRRYTRHYPPNTSNILMQRLSFLEPFINRKKPKENRFDNAHSFLVSPTDVFLQEPNIKFDARSSSVNRCHSPLESSSSVEKQFNVSFFNSLSEIFQTLTLDQQRKCRIDILKVVEKYKDLKIDSKSENIHIIALPQIVSERFAHIINKICSGAMTSFDEDWFLILAVKNFFCKLMEIRKSNFELDRMMPIFKSIETTNEASCELQTENDETQPCIESAALLETPTNRVESIPVLGESAFVPDEIHQSVDKFTESNQIVRDKSETQDQLTFLRHCIQEPEISSNEPNISGDAFSNSARSIAQFSSDDDQNIEKAIHETLKNINSTGGIMPVCGTNQFYCILCDANLATELDFIEHTRNFSHEKFCEEYLSLSIRIRETALPQLDRAVYDYRSGELHCLLCEARIQNRNSFLAHLKSLKHRTHIKTRPISLDIDLLGDRSIGKGIVKINSFNYCLYCDIKILENPSIFHVTSESHTKVMALVEGVFKMSPSYAYCSYCNEVFLVSKLDIHAQKQKHIRKVMKEMTV